MNEPGSPFRLDGAAALVTGAASGIGAATARALVDAGAKVTMLDLESAALIARDGDTGDEPAMSIECDVSSLQSVEAAFTAVREQLGDIAVLVNCAGIALHNIGDGPADEVEIAAWDRTLAVNLTGTFMCIRCALPMMLRCGGGAIVNFASIGGGVAGTENVAYAASKAGIIGLTRSVAVTHANRGIRANAICPGSVETPMTAKMFTPDTLAQRVSSVPTGRQAQPEEMANVAVFLASPASSYLTGAAIVVDGGLTLDIS